jgi:hypothetical protein
MKSLRLAAVFGVVLCLAVTGFATSTAEMMEFIEKANQSQFGKTLMGTIELELNNGAPADYLLRLLNKMRQTLLNDIIQANATHEAFQHKCEKDLAQIKSEIKQHAANVLESRRVISKSQQKLSWDRVERDTSERQLKENKENLAKAESIRKAEAEVYAKKVAELNDALVVLHQGKSAIEAKFQKVSLIQVSNSFKSYVQKMTREISAQSYHGRGYVSLVAHIATLLEAPGIQASSASIKKVLNLIQSIIDELERSKSFEYSAEHSRIANFNEIKGIYVTAIEKLTALISKLTNEIATLEQTIQYNTQRITENIRSIQVKGRQQRKLKKECTKENDTFKKAHAKR